MSWGFSWTSTTVRVIPEPVADNEIDTCHIVCCHDDDRAVCGFDLTGDEWHPEDHEPTCIVCEELQAVENLLPDGASCTCPCCVDVPVEVTA